MWIRSLLLVLPFTLIAAVMPVTARTGTTHPDLSGSWKLNLKRSRLPAKSRLGAETLVVTCNGLSIEMRHASPVDGHEVVQTFVADGKTRTIKQSPQIEIEARAYWQKSSLVVIQTTHQSIAIAAQPAVLTNRWTLSKDGNTLKSELSTLGFLHVYVYDKQ